MSYMAGLVVRASNVEKLLEDMESFGRQAFNAGATDMWITQSVMADYSINLGVHVNLLMP